MDSNKIYVKIGRKYKDSFKSICDLVNGGCIDPTIVHSCKNDSIIETAQYVFEYTDDIDTIETTNDEESKIGMFPSGATWFHGIRSGKSDNAMGMWHNLLESVAENYHKEYSLAEYIEQSLTQTQDELRAYRDTIRKIVSALNYTVSDIVIAPKEESTEDVYALSLRVELFNGAGEPKPLLCKLYFRRQNEDLVPISTAEAAVLDDHIGSVVSKRRASEQNIGSTSKTEIVHQVLNAVSKFIEGKMRLGFSESMLIANETDMQNFTDFLNKNTSDEVRLECRKLKVLGICHAQWVNPSFYVYIENRKAFLAKIDINETVSMHCCCNDADNRLIERNTITCRNEQTGIEEIISLNPNEQNLGLSEEQLLQIREESAFADHFLPINCVETRKRGVECMRYLCKSNSLTFSVNGKTLYRCGNCPYPEVVYYGTDGTPKYTPSLYFDSESLTAVDEETETCRLCGRTYLKEEMDESFHCKFCASAVHAVKNKRTSSLNKKMYKKYAGMLPLSLRVKNLLRKKYCFENSDRVIFFVGKKKFFFDKLKLTDSGKIKAPEER